MPVDNGERNSRVTRHMPSRRRGTKHRTRAMHAQWSFGSDGTSDLSFSRAMRAGDWR
jgi:hypothetical protein